MNWRRECIALVVLMAMLDSAGCSMPGSRLPPDPLPAWFDSSATAIIRPILWREVWHYKDYGRFQTAELDWQPKYQLLAWLALKATVADSITAYDAFVWAECTDPHGKPLWAAVGIRGFGRNWSPLISSHHYYPLVQFYDQRPTVKQLYDTYFFKENLPNLVDDQELVEATIRTGTWYELTGDLPRNLVPFRW
jgi:hypothetical protein